MRDENRNGGGALAAGAGPHGGGDGPGLPADLPGAGGGPDGHGDGQRQGPVLSGQKKPGPAEAVPRGAPGQRPDFRQRPRVHGGGGVYRGGDLRGGPDRHQHGLPGGEDRLQRRRQRPDAGPGEGRPDRPGGGGGLAGAGDGENAPGLGQGQHQRRGAGTDAGAGGGVGPGGPWPHPGPDVRRAGGLGHHPPGEGGGVHSGDGQRRRVFGGGRREDPALHRGRRRDDWPGLSGQSLAVSAGSGGAGGAAYPAAAAPGPAVRYRRAADRAGGPGQGGAHRHSGGPEAVRLVSQGRAPRGILQGTDRAHEHAGGYVPDYGGHPPGPDIRRAQGGKGGILCTRESNGSWRRGWPCAGCCWLR